MDNKNKVSREFALAMLNLQLEESLQLIANMLSENLTDKTTLMTDDEVVDFAKEIMSNPFKVISENSNELSEQYGEFVNSQECMDRVNDFMNSLSNEFNDSIDSDDLDSLVEEISLNTNTPTTKSNKKLQ